MTVRAFEGGGGARAGARDGARNARGRGRRRRGRVAVGAPAPPGRAPGMRAAGEPRGSDLRARTKNTGFEGLGGRGSRPSTRSGDFDAPRGVGRSAHPGGKAPRRAFSICVPSGSSGSACAWKCAPARGDATRRRAGAGRTTPRARGPAGRVRGPRVGASAGLGRASRARLRSRTSARMPARTTPSEPCARGCEGGDARAGDEENPIKPVSRAPGLAKTDWSRPRTKAHSCATVPTGSSRA